MINKTFTYGLALAASLLAGAAQASVITLLDNNLGATVSATCSTEPCLLGITGPTTNTAYSTTQATRYPQQGNPTAELAFLNDLLGPGINEGPVTYVEKDVGAASTWTIDRTYFSVKQSTYLWYMKNNSGVPLTITWSPGQFSHLTEYGDPIPLPGAVWLFGSALVGLVALNRRRRLAA